METTSRELLIKTVREQARQRGAVILVHNYQSLEIQAVADFLGDSLELSKQAASTKAKTIIFCGVRFMAETAKLLNPQARVVLAQAKAGCPMADMINAEQLRQFKAQHPKTGVLCYVNSSAEVKALSDLCCTSGNAIKMAASMTQDELLFIPDRNLGAWVQKHSDKKIICWQGYCPVHHYGFTLSDVKNARQNWPDHLLVIHPEAPLEVLELADAVHSTKGMADLAAQHDKLVLGTEIGMVKALQKQYPQKSIVSLNEKAICPNMKKTTLRDVLLALTQEQDEIVIPEEVAPAARLTLTRMLEFSR